MGKNNKRIRYKYRESKKGVCLAEIRCPVCKNPSINWTKVVEDLAWRGRVVLLAECWSGDLDINNPKHLFLIELEDLPSVEVEKVKIMKRKINGT